MEVLVTLADIEQGQRYNSSRCPIALAVERSLHSQGVDPVRVFVTPAVVIAKFEQKELRFLLPDIARHFQSKFDAARWDDFDSSVEPFAFRLEAAK